MSGFFIDHDFVVSENRCEHLIESNPINRIDTTIVMEQVPEKILNAAAKLFADGGFERTVISDIAKSARVAIPTIYHHFGNKRNLYNRTCVWVFSRKAQAHWRQLTQPYEGGDPQHLYNYLEALARDFMEDKVYYGLMHRELTYRSTQGLKELSEQSFSYAFAELCKLCARISPGKESSTLGLSLHAMQFGLIDMLRFGVYVDPTFKSLQTPTEITRCTVSSLLPEVDWSKVKAVKRRKKTAAKQRKR